MLRTVLSSFVILAFAVAPLLAADNKENKEQKKPAAAKTTKNQQKATITKVNPQKGTITVRMKNKEGKEVEKTFQLTEDIHYFDSTGRAAALDVFQSGNEVVIVEAEGRLKELHQHGDPQSASKGGKFESDQQFLQWANQVDMTEVRLGKLAQANGTQEVVKKFGERMVRDHSQLNKQLQQLASKKNSTLPQKLDEHHQQLLDRLSNLKGKAFDREYAKDMASGHHQALERFEAAAKNARDPEVRTWAAQGVKILKEHLELARQMEKQVTGAAK